MDLRQLQNQGPTFSDCARTKEEEEKEKRKNWIISGTVWSSGIAIGKDQILATGS